MLAGRSQARPSKYASDTDDDRVNDSTTYRQVLESSDEVGSDEEDDRIISSDDSDDDVPLVSKHVNKGGTEDWVSEDEDAPEDEENLSEDGSEELSELSTQQNPAAGKYFLIISLFRPYSNQAKTKSFLKASKLRINWEEYMFGKFSVPCFGQFWALHEFSILRCPPQSKDTRESSRPSRWLHGKSDGKDDHGEDQRGLPWYPYQH